MTYLKVFTDFRELMEPLDDGEKGRLFEAMLAYAEDGSQPTLEGNERFVWAMARRIIDREAEVYRQKVKSAGRARSSRRKTPSDSRGDALISEDASLVSDKEKEKEYEKENDHENEKEEDLKDLSQEYVCVSKENAPMWAGTHIPERGEIESYCRERNNGIDPNYFYDYYAAAGWQVGQHPVRDWRALIRAWEKRDRQQPTGPGPGVGMRATARFGKPRSQTFFNYNDSQTAVVNLKDIELTLDDEL